MSFDKSQSTLYTVGTPLSHTSWQELNSQGKPCKWFKIPILKTLTHLAKRSCAFPMVSEMTRVYSVQVDPTCIRIKPRPKPTTEGRITYGLLLVFEVSPELLQISRNWIPRQFQSFNDITSIPCLILSNECVCKALVKINLKDNKEKPLKTLYL